MMTQSFYGGAELDVFQRPSHRPMSTAGYYDRAAPYRCYDQQRDGDIGGPHHAGVVIHELESDGAAGQTRRRIAVACSRCRRRKIKCSGDPGNGTGCQACRSARADVTACNFVRVGSTALNVAGVETYAAANNSNAPPGVTNGGVDTVVTCAPVPSSYQDSSRTSIPTLCTRPVYSTEYEQFEGSPANPKSYTVPALRHDSFASACGTEACRSCSTSGMTTATMPSICYGQPITSGFGTYQAPSYSQASSTMAHPPSVTTDTLSSLNMGSLHSSLPTQAVQERRLPVPAACVQQHPQTLYSTTKMMEIRPFGEPRVHNQGIHSRNAPPWSLESVSSASRTEAPTTMAAPTSMSLDTSPSTLAPVSEPGFGYQFGMTSGAPSANSPGISPTSGPSFPESFASTSSSSLMPSVPALATFRYFDAAHPLSATGESDDRSTTSSSSSRERLATSLFSFSTETSERPTTDHGHRSTSISVTPGAHGYAAQRQPQPQHPASVEGLQLQSSIDRQRAAITHRMSLSHLNGQY